jgi:hypothetical protein
MIFAAIGWMAGVATAAAVNAACAVAISPLCVAAMVFNAITEKEK